MTWWLISVKQWLISHSISHLTTQSDSYVRKFVSLPAKVHIQITAPLILPFRQIFVRETLSVCSLEVCGVLRAHPNHSTSHLGTRTNTCVEKLLKVQCFLWTYEVTSIIPEPQYRWKTLDWSVRKHHLPPLPLNYW